MNTRLLTGPTFRARLLAFYERNRQALRVGGHVVAWAVFYFVFIHNTTFRIYEDNEQVVRTASIIELIRTVILYYFIGYYLLPTFLYRRNYANLVLILVVIFFIMYQINYSIFQYLVSISDGTHSGGKETHARRIATMLQEAGRLGCFTSLRVGIWNFLNSFGLPILAVVAKVFRDIISYQRRYVTAERDRFALELSFLKAQVNPHFLFNTLNSIYARIFDTDEQAANLVLQLSELMRYNLYETDQPSIGLDKELAYIQNYLDLERNRLTDQNVVIDYEQKGNPAGYQIAPLLLIAFVENAFKHGIRGATLPAYVQVRAEVGEGDLVFKVENSVPPKRSVVERAPISGGVGLGNVRRRLDALYGGRYTLDVTATEKTYTVNLTIRLEAALA